MWNMLGEVLFIATALTAYVTAQDKEVSLEQGVVSGFLSADDQSYRFLGIPYADAPRGSDKFKAPLPPPSWTGTLYANDPTIRCLQPHYGGITHDCLVINVYIPAGLANDASAPVLAITHGGGFVYGSGAQDLLEINRIMAQDIVLVSYNYRLGVTGFLCLGTETAPGNAGLKDQVAALRWIKNNIANFGGDPNDVTLFGYSGGSMSIELLALSEATEGLFNKAILESGSAIGPTAVGYDPIGNAKSAADFLGFPNVEDLNTLEEIFVNATDEELNSAALYLLNSLMDNTVGFCPCIETIIDHSAIVTEAPMNTIQSNNYRHMPIMNIYSDMEGSIRLNEWQAGWNTIFDNDFAEFLPPNLSFQNDVERERVAQEIKTFYMDYTGNEMLAFVDYITDIMFAYSITQSSVLHTENSVPVYLMEFSYHDEHSLLPGANHIDFFGHVLGGRLDGPPNDQVAARGTELIANFIKYDNPVPNTSELLPVAWPTVTPAAINYLAFNDQLTVRQTPIAERYQFLQDIYDRHYKELPIPGRHNDFMEISLEQGTVRGFISQDLQSFRFHGIPFAGVPTGRDRFKAPLAPPSWTGILNATDSTIRCLQPQYGGIVHDCLVMNIYIPAGLSNDASAPVLAITHGGSFAYGSGAQDLLEINRLMSQDIVLVSYNYRLSVMGFLCLGTETVPGNAGLKDQVAALHWIKNNIASFGGDPNDVTLFGYSGGSMSIELLALSGVNDNLFNKAILESGSALGPTAVAYDPIGLAKYAADFMGFPNVDNLNTLEDIFINATPEEINLVTLHVLDILTDMTIGFGPCIETIIDNSTVLAAAPLDLIRANNYSHVPIMNIYADMEGIFRLFRWERGWNTLFDENFSEFLPPNLSFENDEEKEEVAAEIKKFYMDYTGNETLAFVDLVTDIMFAHSIIQSSELHTKNSVPVYLMEISYHDEHSPLPGANHIDFLGHVFNARLDRLPANDLVAARGTEMIVNFIKYDNPVPSTSDLLPVSWPNVTPAAVNYLVLNDQMTVRQSPIAERYQFLQAIYEKHYRELPLPGSNAGLVVRSSGFTLLLLCIASINLFS